MSERDEFIQLFRQLNEDNKERVTRVIRMPLTPGFSEAYTEPELTELEDDGELPFK